MTLAPLCSQPDCSDLAEPGCSRCPKHRVKGGTSAGSAFYRSGAWRRISQAYLRVHRRCAWCGAPAVVVDHIRPRIPGSALDTRPGHQDHERNLQALCRRDHGRKGARHDGLFGNPKRPIGAAS